MKLSKLIYYLPRQLSVRLGYFAALKKPLHLRNPVTFNEKIQYLQLYRYGEREAACSDKFLVREYVQKKGIGSILTELYGVWDDPDAIPFEELPQQFVLKGNHGSGYNIICRDKDRLDQKACIRQLKKWMRQDFSRQYGELHYRRIKRKVIAEEYLEQMDGSITDYKYYCFHGRPECILVCLDRKEDGSLSRRLYYDLDWNPLDYDAEKAGKQEPFAKPEKLLEMNDIARKLSEDFVFVRVDLYCISGKIYFGELTFTPGGGRLPYLTQEAQAYLGGLIHLEE